MTATGVVAGNIPLALGAAFAATVTGDGVGRCGRRSGTARDRPASFHESLNLASLWGLPMLFVCENNGYAEFSPLSAHTKVERLARHAETYGIPAVTVDGNDASAVREAARDGVARARAGGGPTFVEGLTYRLRGHYEGDPGKYRELSELADWKREGSDRAVHRRVPGWTLRPRGMEARARDVGGRRDRGGAGGTAAAPRRPADPRDGGMTYELRFIDGIRTGAGDRSCGAIRRWSCWVRTSP